MILYVEPIPSLTLPLGVVCGAKLRRYLFPLNCSNHLNLKSEDGPRWTSQTYPVHYRPIETSKVSEDAICGVPQRFAERVILAAPRGNQNFASQAQGTVPVPSARRQWWVKWFPDLWDRPLALGCFVVSRDVVSFLDPIFVQLL